MSHEPDEHWVPWDLVPTDGAPMVRWARVDQRVFSKPFFEDDIRLAGGVFQREGRTRLTSLDTLDDWSDRSAELPIQGLVFHTSRCGSTLLMQLLHASGKVAIVAEPPVLDQVLRLTMPQSNWTAQPAQVRRWCQGALNALTQRRGQNSLNCTVVKLDAWLIGAIDELAALVPAAWRIFLFREPAAILSSHRHIRGMFMVPYLLPWQSLGTEGPCLDPANLDRWAAQILLATFQRGKSAVESAAVWPLAYQEVLKATQDTILPASGITVTDEIRARLEACAARNAKRPRELFTAPMESALDTFRLDKELSESLESVYSSLLACSDRSKTDSSHSLVSTSTTR